MNIPVIMFVFLPLTNVNRQCYLVLLIVFVNY